VQVFVMIGIGADDIFVIASCWKETKATLWRPEEQPQRMRVMMSTSFIATFVTTFTTAVAFASNCMSVIAPIRDFAVYSSCVVIANYIFCITLFPAVLVLDEIEWTCWPEAWRQRQRRCERAFVDFSRRMGLGCLCAGQGSSAAVARAGGGLENSEEEEHVISTVFRTLGGFVANHRAKLILLFIALQCVGIMQAMKLRPNDEAPQLFPDDHPITIGKTSEKLLERSGGCYTEPITVNLHIRAHGEEMRWKMDDLECMGDVTQKYGCGPFDGSDIPHFCPAITFSVDAISAQPGAAGTFRLYGGPKLWTERFAGRPVYQQEGSSGQQQEHDSTYIYFIDDAQDGAWYLGPYVGEMVSRVQEQSGPSLH
jgi:hypothetical protein